MTGTGDPPTTRIPASMRAWIVANVGSGSRVVAVRLLGFSSTVLHAVDVVGGGGTMHRLVLRRFHDRSRLGSDPWYLPGNEAAVLVRLEDSDVPAPRLVAADLRPDVCDVPSLLTTRLPGRPPDRPAGMEPFLTQLATALVAIHAVDAVGLPRYAPYHDPAVDGRRRPPVWSRQPRLWLRAFDVAASAPPDTPVGFIHRDYHPDQTLWRRGRLTGVVDWTTGCIGPRGIDLARMQMNLTEFGVEVAERFVAIHEAVSGEQFRHPYWDVLDAADLLLDLPAPAGREEMGSYESFEDWVARAISELS